MKDILKWTLGILFLGFVIWSVFYISEYGLKKAVEIIWEGPQPTEAPAE